MHYHARPGNLGVCLLFIKLCVSGLQINIRSIPPYFKVLRLPSILAVSFNAHHTKALTTGDQFGDYQCVTSTEAPGEGNSLRVSACSSYLITLRMSGSHRATQIFISAVKSLQLLADDVIQYPTVNQSLPKFPDLGAIIRWVAQNRFQRLQRGQ